MNTKRTQVSTTLSYLAVIPLIILGILSILATGGGGGSSGGIAPAPTPPPAPTLALDAGNAEQVAGVALNQILGSSSLGNALPSTVGTSTGVTHRTTLGQLTAKLTQRLAAQLAPAVSPAQMQTETVPCLISGSVTITVSADGTSASATFNACEDFPGERINGSMALSGLTVGLDSVGRINFISGTASVNLTFSVAGNPDVVVTGSFTFTETTTFVAASPSTTTTITGTNLVATSGSETLQLFNFSFTDTFDSMSNLATSGGDFTMDCTVIGGVVAVLTPIAFQTDTASATLPDRGQTEISGANGSRIVVTAIGNELAPVGNQVMLEVDADGDGSFETTINTTWTALDQDCNNLIDSGPPAGPPFQGINILDGQFLAQEFTLPVAATITEIAPFMFRIFGTGPDPVVKLQVTNAIGPGTPASGVLAEFSLTVSNSPLAAAFLPISTSFSLDAGTYFLVASSTAAAADSTVWGSPAPTAIGTAFVAVSVDPAFPPASNFSTTGNKFGLRIRGTPR